MTINKTEPLSDLANRSTKRPLPDGWTRTTVGELGEVVTGTTPRKNEPENYGSHLPFVKPGDLDIPGLVQDATEYLSAIGAEKARVLPPYSVMVTCIGSLGKTGLSGRDVATNQQINSVIPTSSLNARFIYYQFLSSSFQRSLEDGASATTVAIINKTKFSKLPVILAPFSEQERIVAEIEKQFTRLDQAVASLRRLQSNLARYKASVLKAACDGRLVPQDPADEPADQLLARILAERRAQWQAANPGKKYKEPVGVEETAVLPELPEGWVWASLEQIAAHEPNSITDGPFGSKLKTSHYTESGPRVIRLQNIGDGEFINEKAHISEEHYDFLKKHKIFAGDLVIAGLGVSLPRSCIIPAYVGPAIVKADCIRFKPHPEIALANYINAALNSDPLKKFAANIVHGIGRPRLNQQEIKSLAIPLPSLAEQEYIVAEVERRLSVVTAVEQTITANLSRAGRLRQSILHRAFTGQL